MTNHQWRNALRRAWYFVRFRKLLNIGIVRFSFWKKDNTIREAIGTTDLLLIPSDKRPKGNDQSPITKYQCIVFFDLEKQDWRSFNILSFIGFVDVWRLKHETQQVLKEKA